MSEGRTLLVETHSLSKRYGHLAALDQCSLEVDRGEVFGLLGPNGAGKTTLIRLLLGYLTPSAGRATINGLCCHRQSVEVHRQLAYLPAEARIYRAMRARDALRFFAEVRPRGDLQRALGLAERLELDLSKRVAFMSTGMRQKLALAVTLSADTPLLILDEPTSNLDPSVRSTVIAMVAEAKQAGRTVLFSSHVLSEVEEVCDRVAILRAGRLVHTQVMHDLRRRHRLRAELSGDLPAIPPALASTLKIDADARTLDIDVDELRPLLGWLATVPLSEVKVEPIGLRAVYDRFHSSRGNGA